MNRETRFSEGERVEIIDGAFKGYVGMVSEVFPERGVVRVLLTAFGRQAPFDIEHTSVTKAGDGD
jgi:transcription termination/antitermination protein NusG